MNCLESSEHLVLGTHPSTCYKSTSWRAERALFDRQAADRERRNEVNYKQRKFFFLGSLIAGEPHANQHTILYNSGKKPKFGVFQYLMDVRSEACAVD